jgi:bacterioferritin-associated ferredoxin
MMTKSQRIYLMGLWREACEAQHWDHRDETRRHRLYEEVLGVEKRFSHFTNDDFGRVKARLMMLADKLEGAIEDGNPKIDQGRRWRAVLDEHRRCLALYVPDPDAYIAAIARDKFGTPHLDEISPEPPAPFMNRYGRLIERPSPLEQLLMTVNQRINGKTGLRNKAGHTIHEMRTAAGLQCSCRDCVPRARVVVTAKELATVGASEDPF